LTGAGPTGASPTASGAPSSEPVARAVFALLVAACFVAFFLTQRLKHTPTAVQRFKLTPFFSPTPSGHVKEAHISFRLGRSDAVTVTIVNSSGGDVATLVRNRPLTRYKQFSLRWNGRTGTARGYTLIAGGEAGYTLLPATHGPLAAGGEYRVRVSLRDAHTSVLSPRSLRLVRR
jgi:hypothetical protein